MDWLIADSNFYSRLSLEFVRVRLNHILCFFSLFFIQIIAISWLTGRTWINAFIMDKCTRALANVFYIVTYSCLFMLKVAFFRPFYIPADFSTPSYTYQFPVNKKRWKEKFGSHRNLEHTTIKPTVITGILFGLFQSKPFFHFGNRFYSNLCRTFMPG